MNPQLFEFIKYLLIVSLVISYYFMNIKIKKKNLKLIVLICFLLCGTTLMFSKYQHYATDNVNREYVMITKYEYSDDLQTITISYVDENNEEVSEDVSASDVRINFCNGLGEIEKSEREYKKEILLFNTFPILLKSEFIKSDEIIILNQLNFMTEDEINEYYNQ